MQAASCIYLAGYVAAGVLETESVFYILVQRLSLLHHMWTKKSFRKPDWNNFFYLNRSRWVAYAYAYNKPLSNELKQLSEEFVLN